MIEATGRAQRQAWAEGVLPPVEQVRPGLWSVPVPIPGSPIRYLLAYALESRDGITLIDAGWNTDAAWHGLVEGLRAASLDVRDVRRVLVTHLHPDHYGLAGRVRAASGASIGLHPADAAWLEERYGRGNAFLGRLRTLFMTAGVPEDESAELIRLAAGLHESIEVVPPDLRLEDGYQLRLEGWDLRAVWTPGHSPGHVCFYEASRRLLFSGDHLLPRITPSVTTYAQHQGSPLADFLDSLLKVRALEVDEVLPAHEYRFRVAEARVDALIAHHEGRLDAIERIVAGSAGITAWEVAVRLTWSRPWDALRGHARRLAVAETLAHLVLLERRQRVARAGSDPVRWLLGPGTVPNAP